MLSQGKELAAIDFSQVIGGPLEAVITAQTRSAALTSQFIQDTAFEKSNTGSDGSSSAQQLKVVEFNYGQLMGSNSGISGDALTIKVPLLTMLPIPFIRVDSMTIDLNVNLHSTHTVNESNTASASSSASGGQSCEFEHTSFQTSISDKNTYQNNQLVDDTYSLNVTVHAVQDQMPGGMQNVLDIFSNVIQQQSALIQQVMAAEIAAQSKALTQQNSATAPATH